MDPILSAAAGTFVRRLSTPWVRSGPDLDMLYFKPPCNSPMFVTTSMTAMP
jgi:hypothetical protein